MKIHTCEQRTPTWLERKRGKPSTSRFDCIVTPAGRPVSGAKRQGYLYELAAERLAGATQDHYIGKDAERGIALEPHGRSWYAAEAGVKVREVGFVEPDHARWGCSPDGLVDPKGGVEIKCPMPKGHIQDLDESGARYKIQIQGSMWICEREWWDLAIYTDIPSMPCATFRFERDELTIAAFEAELPRFCDDLDALTEKMSAAGAAAPETIKQQERLAEKRTDDGLAAIEGDLHQEIGDLTGALVDQIADLERSIAERKSRIGEK